MSIPCETRLASERTRATMLPSVITRYLPFAHLLLVMPALRRTFGSVHEGAPAVYTTLVVRAPQRIDWYGIYFSVQAGIELRVLPSMTPSPPPSRVR